MSSTFRRCKSAANSLALAHQKALLKRKRTKTNSTSSAPASSTAAVSLVSSSLSSSSSALPSHSMIENKPATVWKLVDAEEDLKLVGAVYSLLLMPLYIHCCHENNAQFPMHGDWIGEKSVPILLILSMTNAPICLQTTRKVLNVCCVLAYEQIQTFTLQATKLQNCQDFILIN